MEVEEQAGRDAASAAGARRAKLMRGAKSFIVIAGSEAKGDGVVNGVFVVYQGAMKREKMEKKAYSTL